MPLAPLHISLILFYENVLNKIRVSPSLLYPFSITEAIRPAWESKP